MEGTIKVEDSAHHCDEHSKHEVKFCESEPTNCGLEIKKEQSPSEDYVYYNQRENIEFPTEVTIKIEETVFNWDTSEYECYNCDGIFRDKASLEQHMNEFHQDDMNVETTQSIVSEEQQNVAEFYNCGNPGSNEKPFICKHIGCEKAFRFKSKLDEHMSVHSEERPFMCEHPSCTRSFKLRRELTRHIKLHFDYLKVVHSDNKIFKCEHIDCNKSFKSRGELNSHKISHSVEKPFQCEFKSCKKSFKYKNYLKLHMSVHSDRRPFKCGVPGCSKSFKVKSSLRGHLRSHNDERPFVCEQMWCRKSFKRNSELRRHIIKLHTIREPSNSNEVGCVNLPESKSEMIVHSNGESFKHEQNDSAEESEEPTIKLEIEIDDEMEDMDERPICGEDS